MVGALNKFMRYLYISEWNEEDRLKILQGAIKADKNLKENIKRDGRKYFRSPKSKKQKLTTKMISTKEEVMILTISQFCLLMQQEEMNCLK